ncbi:MAG: type II toxin-antitoxin system PemK/MazF family toxin [Desulfosalsimonadaceae bacterium]
MNRGDIILIAFPFSDLTSVKVRPALILSPENPAEQDFLVALISSNMSRPISKTDYALSVTNADFLETRLKTGSVFRMSKVQNLNKTLAKRRLGKANVHLMLELEKKLCLALGL